MNVISRLFIMFDQVRLQMHRPIGEIFDYTNGFNGLKMMAEAIQRGRAKGIASLLIPPDGVHSILTIPSGKCGAGFRIDGKVQAIKTSGNYVLLMQYELFLQTDCYLMIDIDEEGTEAHLYSNRRDRSLPHLLTSFELHYVESEHELLEKIFKVAIGELRYLNEELIHSGRASELMDLG